jgi:NAD(P)-dependent dehydrogenase (short-subunit alcohol dehydrogenase family)
MAAEVVVVTGSTGGIGSAICERLVAEGRVIVGIDRASREPGPGYRHVLCELSSLATDTSARRRLTADLDRARSALSAGPLIGLVNNAAEQIVKPALDLDVAEFRRSMDVNVLAPLVLAQMLHAELAAAGGVIVNVSSVHARLTKAGFCAYSTSKAALSGLSRALAVEWGRQVRIVTLELAAVGTPMLEAGFAGRPEARARLDEAHPSGVIGTPVQVADWVFQCLSARSAFVNGAVLQIDGGVSGRLHDPG